MKKRKYDLFFSLGEACSCTSILRSCKLQFKSFPFDWVSESSIEKRCDVLCGKLNNWFEKEDFEFVQKLETEEQNLVYKNRVTLLKYPHEFFANKPFEENFDNIKSKYERRFNRLKSRIKESKNVLVVYIQLPVNNEVVEDNRLIETQKAIQEAFPSTTVDLLYICHNPDINVVNSKEKIINDNVTRVSFDYLGDPTGVHDIVYTKKLKYYFNNYYRSTLKYVTFKNFISLILNDIKVFTRRYILQNEAKFKK